MTNAAQNSFASNLNDIAAIFQELSGLLQAETAEQHDDHCWAWRIAPEYPYVPATTFSGRA